MLEKQNGGNSEEVPLEKIVLSNMYSMEPLLTWGQKGFGNQGRGVEEDGEGDGGKRGKK